MLNSGPVRRLGVKALAPKPHNLSSFPRKELTPETHSLTPTHVLWHLNVHIYLSINVKDIKPKLVTHNPHMSTHNIFGNNNVIPF